MGRSNSRAKAAGRNMERGTANYLAVTVDDDIDRQIKTGAKDTGDVRGLRFHGHKVAVECKDTSKMSLQAWLREAEVERVNLGALAGIVVHKRIGVTAVQDQYVTLTLRDLASLMTGERVPDLPDIRIGQPMPVSQGGTE